MSPGAQNPLQILAPFQKEVVAFGVEPQDRYGLGIEMLVRLR